MRAAPEGGKFQVDELAESHKIADFRESLVIESAG
jgi:hypothetical protein